MIEAIERKSRAEFTALEQALLDSMIRAFPSTPEGDRARWQHVEEQESLGYTVHIVIGFEGLPGSSELIWIVVSNKEGR